MRRTTMGLLVVIILLSTGINVVSAGPEKPPLDDHTCYIVTPQERALLDCNAPVTPLCSITVRNATYFYDCP